MDEDDFFSKTRSQKFLNLKTDNHEPVRFVGEIRFYFHYIVIINLL